MLISIVVYSFRPLTQLFINTAISFLMNIGYLLSSIFPYDKLICSDAGYAIAYEYGWTPFFLDSVSAYDFDAVVVDNRHQTKEDIIAISDYLRKCSCSIFFRVNDPYIFHRGDPWYRFCSEMADSPRVHFLTPYQPTGLLSYWLSYALHSSFIFAPFTYDPNSEVVTSHSNRRSLIAVSGNQRLDLYPLRYLVQKASRLPFSKSFFRVEYLRHPGYPEKVSNTRHNVIGSAYIHWLSQFACAFADSSIYRVELLKYREIAYAGCALIGDLPWSLYECPDDAFIEFKSVLNLLPLRASVFDHHATQHVANSYRQFLRNVRCQTTWRNKVSMSIARFC